MASFHQLRTITTQFARSARYRLPQVSLRQCRSIQNLSSQQTQIDLPERQNPLDDEDYFNVRDMVSLKELFDARVHLGHHEGVWNPATRPYIYGKRSYNHIIDLEQSLACFHNALNVLSHVAYRKGIVMFVSTNPKFDYLIQKTARSSQEYFVTRNWKKGTFTNAYKMLGASRLPDLMIAMNLGRFENGSVAVQEAAMCNIPTIGIIDTDCDPHFVTYPIPGNDDTMESVELYCRKFQQAILNAKEQRKIDNSAKD